MAKSNGALPQQTGPMTATWAKREAAAYRTAEQEIGRLPAGEAIVYHEGNLAIDIENDPDVAGRAAAFRAAAEAARGRLAQRRLASNAINTSSGGRIMIGDAVTVTFTITGVERIEGHGRLLTLAALEIHLMAWSCRSRPFR